MSTLSERLLGLDLLLQCEPEDADLIDWIEAHGGDVRGGACLFGAPDGWAVEMLGIEASDETLWDAAVNWGAAARARLEGPRTLAAIVNAHPLELAAEARRAAP